MLFTTGEFAFLFLPIVAVTFYLLGRSAGLRIAIRWLVLASVVFYAAWRPEHVPLLLISILGNYAAGKAILRARVQTRVRLAKTILAIALTLNLVLLTVFKYAAFLLSSFDAVTGLGLDVATPTLPLGISFFTFTQIAYLVDAYSGKVADEDPGRYALFVTYFPHLIAGPVLHHSEMMPQFSSDTVCRVQLPNITMGLLFFCAGLVKKVVIADSFAPIANELFSRQELLPAAMAWMGALSYGLQIYFDFSGYSDMAVGLSLLFNVRLPYNFNSPYKATSVVDFWRRWHMTLSRFLRDYLYIPLGGNRHGVIRQHGNLLMTMLLGGLWHGASWCFVVWGGLHGVYLIVNHVWSRLRLSLSLSPRGPIARGLSRFLAWTLTMSAVTVAWVFFRSPTLQDATRYASSMFRATGVEAPAGIVAGSAGGTWWWIAALFIIAGTAPNTQQLIDGLYARWVSRRSDDCARRAQALLTGSSIVLCFLIIAISQSKFVTEFIYFNF